MRPAPYSAERESSDTYGCHGAAFHATSRHGRQPIPRRSHRAFRAESARLANWPCASSGDEATIADCRGRPAAHGAARSTAGTHGHAAVSATSGDRDRLLIFTAAAPGAPHASADGGSHRRGRRQSPEPRATITAGLKSTPAAGRNCHPHIRLRRTFADRYPRRSFSGSRRPVGREQTLAVGHQRSRPAGNEACGIHWQAGMSS